MSIVRRAYHNESENTFGHLVTIVDNTDFAFAATFADDYFFMWTGSAFFEEVEKRQGAKAGVTPHIGVSLW